MPQTGSVLSLIEIASQAQPLVGTGGESWGLLLKTEMMGKKVSPRRVVFINNAHELHCLENKVTVLIIKVIPDALSNTYTHTHIHTHTHTHSSGTGPSMAMIYLEP